MHERAVPVGRDEREGAVAGEALEASGHKQTSKARMKNHLPYTRVERAVCEDVWVCEGQK